MRFLSPAASTVGLRRRRFCLEVRPERRCLSLELRRTSFPVPVTFMRFLTDLFVFIFGMGCSLLSCVSPFACVLVRGRRAPAHLGARITVTRLRPSRFTGCSIFARLSSFLAKSPSLTLSCSM